MLDQHNTNRLLAIETRVTAILADDLNLAVLGSDTDLIGERILNSSALVDLVVHLESSFGFTVALGQLDLENFQTVKRKSQMVAAATAEPSYALSAE